MIADCLKAAGVKRVIWIDDNFADRNRDECGVVIQDALRKLKEDSKERKIKVKAFPEFDLELSENELLDLYEQAVKEVKDKEVLHAADALERLAGLTKDLTPAQFEELLSACGHENVIKQSLKKWTSKGAEDYSKAGEDTLFLIDREYDRERVKFDGLQILKDLAHGEAYYIMFTSDCLENQEENKRLEYSGTFGIRASRFTVVAKNGTAALTDRFAQALRGAFTHRQTTNLAEQLRSIMGKATEKVIDSLAAQTVADVDRVIFQNSIREGASELDVLMRIFALQQRNAVRTAFKDAATRSALIQMRKFRADTVKLKLAKHDKTSLDQFRSWRKVEVYEDGGVLNPLYSPLACGDVFTCPSPKNAEVMDEYILLAQPCDLMVRDKPKRNAEVGLLVKLVTAAERPQSDAPSRYRELIDVMPDGKKWFADFKAHTVVDLAVIDWCVFNVDGAVKLRADGAIAHGLLTVGYEKLHAIRLAMLAGHIADTENKLCLPAVTLGPRVSDYPVTVDRTGGEIKTNLKRIGRLDGFLAQATLAAWATFQTRAALDHDFTEIRERARPKTDVADAQIKK